MKKKYDYDIVVVGGGAAGLSAAKTAAGFGKKTLLIEHRKTGGECTWNGCIPSKALIRTAHAAYEAKQLFDDLEISRLVDKKTSGSLEQVRDIIRSVYSGEDPETLEKEGISVVEEHAVIIDKNTLNVGDRIITTKKIILALGSSPFIPRILGLTKENCLTNENIFEMPDIPESLLVLGAGPLGIELAQAFSRLGTKISIIIRSDRILRREEKELSDILKGKLEHEGIKFIMNTEVLSYSKNEKDVEVRIRDIKGNEDTLIADALLCAVGRDPNTKDMGLEEVGVKFDSKGIITDPYLRTSVPGIFACGDVVGPYRFSHVAGRQGVMAALNAILPVKLKMNMDTVLWTTYTDPEFSRIGMTRQEAHEKKNGRIRVINIPYDTIDRAVTENKTTGLAKFILDKRNRILGAHILGASAGEIIHEAALLKKMKKPLSYAKNYMHAYPSYSDVMAKAAQKAFFERTMNNPFVKIVRKVLNK